MDLFEQLTIQQHFILNSLICFGIVISTKQGNILYPLVYKIEEFKDIAIEKEKMNIIDFLVLYLSKPLYSCVYCCASIWGIVYIYTSNIFPFSWNIPFWILALAGFNYLISKIGE